jgi:hypothetical protein
MRAMHRRAPKTLATRLSLLGLVAVLFFAVACSGGGDSGAKISDAEATTAANNYLKTTLGLFTGSTPPQDFINLYAPECREGVDPASLAFVSSFMQGMAPDLKGTTVEAVDAGPLEIKKADDGAFVTPKDPSALKVQVNGEFKPASDFRGAAGFTPSEPSDSATPLHLVRRDDQIFIANCDELRDLAGGLGGS